MHLLQVANVGEICGGTAACAWSVTRALPMCQHTVIFLSPLTPETRLAFQHCHVLQRNSVSSELLGSIDPDFCLLHNTAPGRFPVPVSVPTVLYRHSAGTRISCDLEIACSHWLARQTPHCRHVLYQGVPTPSKPFPGQDRRLRTGLVVGRICTPVPHKWPGELKEFYSFLASRHPLVDWEFVGSPPALQSALQEACRGKARFLKAGWEARKHLWKWDALLYHHPTLTESFGRTVAEAMRAGCIPIVDRRGGFTEQVSPETGFLCKTLQDFDAALQILEDPVRRREYSGLVAEAADRKFSLTAFSGRLQKLIQQFDPQVSSAGFKE